MWPLAALAQQSERVGRIGVLMPNIGPILQSELIAFLAALKGLGWEEGRNLQMDVSLGRERCGQNSSCFQRSWSVCDPT